MSRGMCVWNSTKEGSKSNQVRLCESRCQEVERGVPVAHVAHFDHKQLGLVTMMLLAWKSL